MKPTILLFNITDKTKYANILKVAMPLKVRIKKVDIEDYLQPIGYLAGKKEIASVPEKYEGTEFDEEMLLISDFTDTMLNQLLNALRKSAVRINFKAVMTQTNEKWNPIQLYEELSKEHEQLNK